MELQFLLTDHSGIQATPDIRTNDIYLYNDNIHEYPPRVQPVIEIHTDMYAPSQIFVGQHILPELRAFLNRNHLNHPDYTEWLDSWEQIFLGRRIFPITYEMIKLGWIRGLTIGIKNLELHASQCALSYVIDTDGYIPLAVMYPELYKPEPLFHLKINTGMQEHDFVVTWRILVDVIVNQRKEIVRIVSKHIQHSFPQWMISGIKIQQLERSEVTIPPIYLEDDDFIIPKKVPDANELKSELPDLKLNANIKVDDKLRTVADQMAARYHSIINKDSKD